LRRSEPCDAAWLRGCLADGMCAQERPRWIVPGAKGTWLSKSSSAPQPVTVSSVDPGTGAVTVTFVKDPMAFKVVPASRLGQSSRLQPARREPKGPGDVPKSPLELAAEQLKRERDLKRQQERDSAEAEQQAQQDQQERDAREQAHRDQRRRRDLERELAAELAERERERKVEELRRWREEEDQRERREVEDAKAQVKLRAAQAEEQKRRAEENKQRLKRERRAEQAEEEAWARLKEEALQAEKKQPSWAMLGAKCTWASASLKKLVPVTITGVDAATGAVTVTFDTDPRAFKVVTLEQLGGSDCPLQPKWAHKVSRSGDA